MSYDALQEGAKNVSREVCVGACLQKAVAGVEVEPAIHLSLALRPCDALHALFRLSNGLYVREERERKGSSSCDVGGVVSFTSRHGNGQGPEKMSPP